MTGKTARRQRFRTSLLLPSFIAFPVTMNYFSPYLVIESASLGIVNANCPMSIDVQEGVRSSSMEDSDCALCGSGVDGCAQHAISYSFSSGRQRKVRSA